MSAPMHGETRRPETPHTGGPVNEYLNEGTERDNAGDLGLRHRQSSVFGDEPQNQTGNHRLRSILKSSKSSRASSRQASQERANMATASSEGPRQRTTESTPIAPSKTSTYDSISPVQTSGAERSSISNGAAPQEGTTGAIEPGKPQRITEDERRAQNESSEGGWWSDFWEKWGSVELENKGSVARDHLALGTCSRSHAHLTPEPKANHSQNAPSSPGSAQVSLSPQSASQSPNSFASTPPSDPTPQTKTPQTSPSTHTPTTFTS
jgi:hypothetical protein